MLKQVFWSPSAETDLNRILNYLLSEWGINTAVTFSQRTFALIELIQANPKIFPIINQELSVRKCVLTKQNSLYYRESTDQINILRIFDTRQHPDKLKIL